MLTEKDIDILVDKIIYGAQEKYITELTDALIDNLVGGVFTSSEELALEALARMNSKQLNDILLRNQNRISKEVISEVQRTLLAADAGVLAALQSYYGKNALKAGVGTPQAKELAYQTARGLAEIINRQNIVLKAEAERTWYKIAGEAITAKNMGVKPIDKIIAEAVKNLSLAGIAFIDYKSGISNHIDVATRRHLVTQASQAGGDMTMARLKEYGHDLVITSAHYGARPTHAEWQGKPCSLSGPQVIDGVRYPNFDTFTEYGTVGGLKGVNCRHSFGPYYPGITDLPDLNFPLESKHFGMTSEEYYQATQRQRELERRIRQTKREIAAMERAGLGLSSPEYVQKRLILGKQQTMLGKHCADNKLVRQYKREKAYGIGNQPRPLRGSQHSSYVSLMRGRVNVSIDRFVPCLLDTKTGELIDTEVFRLSKSQLKGYNSKNGWGINWAMVPNETDVYGLTLKGSNDLQGLIAVKIDDNAQAAYLHYLKTAPHNDKYATGKQLYEGVGGHLLAIAVEQSEKAGFGGYLYGFAESAKLEKHYIKNLGATHYGLLHPYHFVIDEKAAKKLLEVYNYKWK